VAQGPDGAFYVGQLTGFPFQHGAAKVWRIVPGHAPTVYASGFTCISGVTFDERGRLVVLEMTTDADPDPFNATQTGALVRVEHNGQQTTLASAGLLNLGGVTYAGHGTYYVTTETAGADGAGQLVKIHVPD